MRTFFTLVPDADTAVAIDNWCGLCWPALARRIPVQNYHMTVVFLGETGDAEMYTLADLMEGFTEPSFDMQLNDVGYFADTGLLWLGSKVVPAELLSLQKKCVQFANRIGSKASVKRYKPHITLARKTVTPPTSALIDPEFIFSAERLELWSSERTATGARYATLASWPLR